MRWAIPQRFRIAGPFGLKKRRNPGTNSPGWQESGRGQAKQAASDVRFRLFRGSEEAPPSRGMVFVGAAPSVKGRGRDE